ncbi:hypothetical protein [Mesorhizobium sp. URHB0026]
MTKSAESSFSDPKVRVVDGGLHIDGYPDAAYLVLLKSKKAKRLVRLRAHQSALIFCERAMQELGAIPEDRSIAREAVLVGVAVKFFSCFGQNAVVGPLSANRVFTAMPDARECYAYWKDIRDKHIVHDESALTFEGTGLVLGSGGDLHDVLSMKVSIEITDREHAQLLYDLIDHTLKHLEKEVSDLLPAVFEEAAAMTADERLSLPCMSFTKPNLSDVATRR